MTIGTPIGNDGDNMNCLLYDFFIFCWIAGFAAYDLRYQRVPGRALAFFCPAAFAAPLFHAHPLFYQETLLLTFGVSLAGAATGFFILLTAALLSENGTGIGGGDIKLAALMGFVYGPYQMMAILVIASGLALIPSLAIKKKNQSTTIALPFVPFLAFGTLVIMLLNTINR